MVKMVKKSEIIKRVATKKNGANNLDPYKLQECTQYIDYLEDVITEVLLNGDKIAWKGFMNIKVTQRKTRRGRNPNTGEVVDYPPVKTICCRMSKQIKDLVNDR